MKKNTLCLFLLIFVFACQQNQERNGELQMIPKDKIVEMAKAGKLNYLYAKFKSQNGTELSKEEQKLLSKGKLAKDYYVDKEGTIKEVRVRPLTLEDKFIEIQRREIASNPLKDITIIEIDCDALDDLYAEIERTDQEVRTEGGDMQSVDAQNQQKVISALTKCGWTEAHLETIWLVFQHSSSGIMAYYYPKLKEYSEKGLVRLSSMALMEDRLLMSNGYKQIYGSQIRDGRLYALEDSENVNKRRAKMDLGPIEEYVTHFDLDFETELANMKNEEVD